MDENQDVGRIDMQRLGELLIVAAKNPQDKNGMVISATGALSIAARALAELAEPLDEDEHDAGELRRAHCERLKELRPRSAAFSLGTMSRHLGMLKKAVDEGDAGFVGRFFTLYVLD